MWNLLIVPFKRTSINIQRNERNRIKVITWPRNVVHLRAWVASTKIKCIAGGVYRWRTPSRTATKARRIWILIQVSFFLRDIAVKLYAIFCGFSEFAFPTFVRNRVKLPHTFTVIYIISCQKAWSAKAPRYADYSTKRRIRCGVINM